MTEVPEYLLRRSRERREALGLATGGGDAPPPSGDALPPPSELAAPGAAPDAGAEVPAVVEPEPQRSRVPHLHRPGRAAERHPGPGCCR